MCRLLLMTISCLLILFGISGLWMMPKLVQQKIEQRIQLKLGTKTFDRFTKVPIPLTVKFYLFNITNSEQVLLGLERPQFKEVGPFMYKQWRRREITDFIDFNRKLVYKEFKTFYPMFSTGQQNKSPGADRMLNPYDVNITIVNLPLLTVLTQLAKLEEGSLKRQVAARVASRLIKDGRDKILTTRPANQILFDGYKVDFMESARDLVSGTLGFNFDSPLPKNMFGFFYNKNGTWSKRENGLLTVSTGRNGSMSDFMLVDAWNDQKELSVWPTNTEAGNRCNQIRGTDGSQFHPGVNREQMLDIFSPLVCTSLQVRYKEDTQVRDIPLLRFVTPAELFAAPRKTPKNACYCTIQKAPTSNHNSADHKGDLANGRSSSSPSSSKHQQVSKQPSRQITDARCYLDGLMDLSLCQRGAPVAASSPHFYNADPMLSMAAGLKPNKSIHETYLDIEPMTGAVMRAASRAQLNAFVEQAALEVVEPTIIGHMAPMVAPLLWLEESAEIDEKSSLEFKSQLLSVVIKAKRTFYGAILIGCLLALAVGIQYWYLICFKLDKELARCKRAPSLSSPSSSVSDDNDDDDLEARKEGDSGVKLSTYAARRQQRRRRSQTKRRANNLRLGADARKSNLAAKDQRAMLVGDTDDDAKAEDQAGGAGPKRQRGRGGRQTREGVQREEKELKRSSAAEDEHRRPRSQERQLLNEHDALDDDYNHQSDLERAARGQPVGQEALSGLRAEPMRASTSRPR